MNHSKNLSAICLDYRGTLVDHNNEQELVSGMGNLLDAFKEKNVPMALISRFPADILIERLGSLKKYFKTHIYSGGGKEKLNCIKIFAQKLQVDDLSQIAFIDDKPNNFLPVSKKSDIFVIGFKGSGKYPDAENICREEKIAFAKTSHDIKNILSAHFPKCFI
ncbi:MAG: hypothetical protein R6U27_11075 [Desulfobacterales bacterium]